MSSAAVRVQPPDADRASAWVSLPAAADRYVQRGSTPAARRTRRAGVAGFLRRFGDLEGWRATPVAQRRQVRTEVMSFVGHAVVACAVAVDVDFAVASGCRWGKYLR